MPYRLIHIALLALLSTQASPLPALRPAEGQECDGPALERLAIEPRWLHLRQHGDREWSSFAKDPDGRHLEARFNARKNATEATLQFRQLDVKQAWRILLNGKPLGELVRDESEMVVYLPIATGTLIDGENTLRIESTAQGPGTADDIRVGELLLVPRPRREVLGQATIEVEVIDADSRQLLPARITIVDDRGGLQTTDAISNEGLAVRPGVIYSKDGRARFGAPVGRYTIYAGRGFEYSLAEKSVTLAKAGPMCAVMTRMSRIWMSAWLSTVFWRGGCS